MSKTVGTQYGGKLMRYGLFLAVLAAARLVAFHMGWIVGSETTVGRLTWAGHEHTVPLVIFASLLFVAGRWINSMGSR